MNAKKRILFVDDEPLILQGIQRMLRPMRQEWDMDFAEGGEQAKIRLGTDAYDVIVTDMMMPGMDGAQLLSYVKEQTPKTIRLVLSGHAEQQLAMKCIGVAHQYLSKPCDATTLKSIVSRVTDSRFAICNEPVMALVAQLENLPSIPTSYSELVRLLNDPDFAMEDAGALIGRDMAMTAKILQLVNSSFFGLARRVTKPGEAVSFLGMETLKALVLAANVFGQFESQIRGPFCTAAADHSQRVGAAARAIAQAEEARRSVVDEAFIAGMLHDVGKLVFATSLPEQFYRAITSAAGNPIEAERAVFGATHADVGGYLLGLWGLPAPVVEAISLHHSPADSAGREFSALAAVHVADCFVNDRSDFDMEYLARLGVTDRLPIWRTAVQALSAFNLN